MALTLDGLKKLLEDQQLRYFVAPDRPAVMLGVTGLCGQYQFVISLESDGVFLQFRTISYLHCPADHPHLAQVLQLLGTLNYQTRLVKFGWDPSDGEIVAYADIWLMDASLTPGQFERMLHNYVPAIDTGSARIKETMATGKDPGEEEPAQMAARMLGGSLPPAIRELLDRLSKSGGAPAPAPPGPPDFSSI
jgi:hypothetical protein